VDEDLMETFSDESKDLDLEDEEQGWQVPSTKRKKKKKLNQVVVASRTSMRIPRDGIPVAVKASARVAARDNFLGIANTSNPFTVLNSTPTSLLQSVIADLNIEGDNVEEQIGVFRAEEIARAALAEANYKVFLDRQKERDKRGNPTENPKDGKIRGEQYELVITNDMRSNSMDLPQGRGGDRLQSELIECPPQNCSS
jgi:hypothetical protein